MARRRCWSVVSVALWLALAWPLTGRAGAADWWVQWPGQVGRADLDGGGAAVLTLSPECRVWVPAGMRFDALRVCWRMERAWPAGWGEEALCEAVQRRSEPGSVRGRTAYTLAAPVDAGYFYQVRLTLQRGGRTWAYQMRVLLLEPQTLLRGDYERGTLSRGDYEPQQTPRP